MLKGAQKIYVLGDIRLYECPLSWFRPKIITLLSMVQLTLETKQLLFSGGWARQPAWFVEAATLYQNEVAQWHLRNAKSK